MEDRLIRVLESAFFIAIFLSVYWVVGFFCKSTFHLELRESHLNARTCSEYQQFLYRRVIALRQKGWPQGWPVGRNNYGWL